jgi:hypothetical protein
MKTSNTRPIEVIPQPRSVIYTTESYSPAMARRIVVSNSPESRFAARLLRQGIRETFGIDCEISLPFPNIDSSPVLYLTGDDGQLLQTEAPMTGHKEGYTLTVTKEGIKIIGEDKAGLFYGVQTLIQLFEQAQRDQSDIPGVIIEDGPVFSLRGTYIDTDQFKGSVRVTLRNLEDMIRQISRFKLNFMVLEIYNLMPFESFPYCADEDTLTLANWKYLVELAHAHHVVIMPSLQSFAQMYDVLWPCEEGKPYREIEEDAWPGIICPSRPEGIELLKGLYKDLLKVFKYTPFLGIGCSEVGMGWKNFCPQCQHRLDSGETLNDIYEKHVCRCIQAVKETAAELGRDVRAWMWGDEFYCAYSHRDHKNFEGMESIPKDTVICHWAYWSKIWSAPSIGDYKGIKGLLERGYDVSFASASYLYNTYLLDLSPDVPGETTLEYNDVTRKFYLTIDSGIANITDQSRMAEQYQKEHPANALIGGICATFSQHDIKCWDTTWYAYALHGDYTWGDPERPIAEYKEIYTYKFAAAYYKTLDRKTAEGIAEAYLQLDAVKNEIERNNYLIHDVIGEYDIQDNAYIGNTLEKSCEIIRDRISKEGEDSTWLNEIRTRGLWIAEKASKIRKELAALASGLRNTSSWAYLITAAKKIENHGKRTVYLIDQEIELVRFERIRDPEIVGALKRRLSELRDETRMITDEVNELSWGRGESAAPWSPSGDSTGFNQVLRSLEGLLTQLAEKIH